MSKRKFVAELKRLGFVGSLAYYIPRSVSRITLGRLEIFPIAFFVQPVNTGPLLVDRLASGVVVGPLSPDSVPDASFGRPEGVIIERFESGHTCIAVLKDSALLGFMWISFGVCRERLFRCEFEPKPDGFAAWDYDFFVAPRYRLGRTFARLWDGAREYLRARGFKASVSWIELSNVGSIRAHVRLGARRVGWAVFVTAWDAQATLSSIAPYLHWSPPGGRPVRICVYAKLASVPVDSDVTTSQS